MRKVYDIKTDADGDIDLSKGFQIEESTQKHQERILLLEQGLVRQAPFVGVGITDYLLDDDSSFLGLKHKIQRNYEMDGLKILSMKLPDTIKAVYD